MKAVVLEATPCTMSLGGGSVGLTVFSELHAQYYKGVSRRC